MFLRRIRLTSQIDVPYFRQNVAISVFPSRAAQGLLFLVLIPTLPLTRALCPAQETPATFDDLSARAAAARDQQNIPLAIQLYTQAEQLKPDWQEGWWYLGVLQYSSNQFPGAVDAFTHLLQLTPTAVPAIAMRGLCEFETAAYDDSLRDLEQAVAHGALNEPRNEQIIRFHLAQLFTRAGRFEDALEQYRFFATHQLDAPDLMIAIALAGMRVPSFPKDVPDQAREIFQAAGKAGYTFLSGDDEQADNLFTQLFASFPSAPDLHLFYGLLLFPHDPEMATDQFQDELSVAPNNGTVNALLALALVMDGRFSKALQPAQRAYDASPEMEMAQVALGRALAETGDTKRGTELLNHVLERDPASMEAHLGLVSIYSRSGNRQEAEKEKKVCRELAK
jgi:tetratricopeptide (TPR) repeat protein